MVETLDSTRKSSHRRTHVDRLLGHLAMNSHVLATLLGILETFGAESLQKIYWSPQHCAFGNSANVVLKTPGWFSQLRKRDAPARTVAPINNRLISFFHLLWCDDRTSIIEAGDPRKIYLSVILFCTTFFSYTCLHEKCDNNYICHICMTRQT